MKKILADDYIGTDAGGSISTKAQHIETVKSHKEEMLSVVSDEWKVRVYGDAGVVMARNTVKMQLEGKESTFQTRFTDTLAKSAGRWQCVANHISIIPQK